MKKIISLFILYYLRFLAKLQLKKNSHAIIIGVTGSAGKSSTRRALSLILSTKGKVKESVRANSESGIPLNILGLSPHNYSLLDWLRIIILAPLMLLINWEKFDYYVVEMGIDNPKAPKNMSYLLSIIKPHVGIVLNAGLVHSDSFDYLVKDRQPTRRAEKIRFEIAKEKMKLATQLDPTGIAIVNTDQKELKKLANDVSARLLSFGKHKGSYFHFSSPKVSLSGFSFSFHYQGQDFSLSLPYLFEPSYAYTFSAALSATTALGISPKAGIKALENYHAPAGRSSILAGIKDSIIVDSSYNSSPDSMFNMLKLLDKVGGKHYKLAIIGDMRELGKQSKHAHRNLAAWISKYSDEALLFGKETKTHTFPLLTSKNFPVHHFTHMNRLIEYLATHIKPKSLILVKGSQNTIFLERATASLLAHQSDLSRLCRRGKYWDKRRSQID
jgi:UDP-N-acetylmuramoyl-tripeptide--D-alanyl-D-alanine ligase